MKITFPAENVVLMGPPEREAPAFEPAPSQPAAGTAGIRRGDKLAIKATVQAEVWRSVELAACPAGSAACPALNRNGPEVRLPAFAGRYIGNLTSVPPFSFFQNLHGQRPGPKHQSPGQLSIHNG